MDDGAATLRVAFWNTWLLRPRLWKDGPVLPGGAKVFAPDVEARAPLVGEAVRDRFDVIAMSEVFEASEQRAVAAAHDGDLEAVVDSLLAELRDGLPAPQPTGMA